MDPYGGSRSVEELTEIVAAQQALIDHLTSNRASSDVAEDPIFEAEKESGGEQFIRAGEPDEVVVHVPSTCSSCGRDLDDAVAAGLESHRVLDLPDIRISVIEHQAERRRCSCGIETISEIPELAAVWSGYGPGVRALAAYLVIYQHISLERTAQIFADVFGHEISVGSLAQIVVETDN